MSVPESVPLSSLDRQPQFLPRFSEFGNRESSLAAGTTNPAAPLSPQTQTVPAECLPIVTQQASASLNQTFRAGTPQRKPMVIYRLVVSSDVSLPLSVVSGVACATRVRI